jgi:hypothetical protein
MMRQSAAPLDRPATSRRKKPTFRGSAVFLLGKPSLVGCVLVLPYFLVLLGSFSRQQGAVLVPTSTLLTDNLLPHGKKSMPSDDKSRSRNSGKDNDNDNDVDDPDKACPFRNSTIYRSVYVYPSPGDDDWQGSILSPEGRLLNNSSSSWP